MTTKQIAIVARDAIHEAADRHGLTPQQVHDIHHQFKRDGRARYARAEAMRVMNRQGVTCDQLAEAFNRSVRVVQEHLALVPNLPPMPVA